MGRDSFAGRAVQRVLRWRPDRWVLVAWALVLLPIVVATVNAIRHGWLPVGDNAFVAIRSRDVLTSHHPWLGTWSSASVDAGTDLNHPGPLLFESLWPSVRLFGGRGGVAVGTALINALSVTTLCVFAFRRGGRRTAIAALAAAAALVYTMGSELLFDPWNPHILMLACLAMVVVVWSIALGDRWAWPVFVALGSYCLQVHVGYVYLVPALLLVAVAAGWLTARLCPRGPSWLPARRTIVVAAVTGLVLWAQPLWEQLAGAGDGNMSRLLGAAGGSGPKIGASLAVRLTAAVLIDSPLDARDGFTNSVPGLRLTDTGALRPLDAPATPWAAAFLVLLVAAIVLLARGAVRRHDRVVLSVLAVAAGSLLVALATVVIMPVGPLGLAAHQMRWLWPITWFVWMAVAMAAVRWAVDLLRARERRWSPSLVATSAATLAMAVLAVLGIPTFQQQSGPVLPPDLIPLLDELDGQLGGLEGRGVVYVDTTNEPFLDPISAAVMAELQRRGIEFSVGQSWLIRQLGNDRRLSGDETVTVTLPRDADALVVPEGAQLEALVTPLSIDEQDELAVLRDLQLVGDPMTEEEQARLDDLIAAAAGSVAVISFPGGPGESAPLP